MSRLEPPFSNPFALHSATAAATQSGAPLGAILHFSWPRTTRALGRRATASAASLGVVDRGAGGDAGFLAEILELVARAGDAGVEIVRRLIPPAADRAEKSLRFGRRRLSAASCAAASPALSKIAPASSAPSAAGMRACSGNGQSRLLSMAGQTDTKSAVLPNGICAGAFPLWPRGGENEECRFDSNQV